MFRCFICVAVLACVTSPTQAGTRWEITSQKGEESVTYSVDFGGGKAFEQYTAWDPASKKFVYLTWPRGEAGPGPVNTIWNHSTGDLVKLFQFPDVKHPLPVIPSIDAIKVCPKTGDRNFGKKETIIFD